MVFLAWFVAILFTLGTGQSWINMSKKNMDPLSMGIAMIMQLLVIYCLFNFAVVLIVM